MGSRFNRLMLAVLVACLLISTVIADSQARRDEFTERSHRKGFNPRLKKRAPAASPKYIKRATATTASSAAAAAAPTTTNPYVYMHSFWSNNNTFYTVSHILNLPTVSLPVASSHTHSKIIQIADLHIIVPAVEAIIVPMLSINSLRQA